jgi:hypothetical protein
MERVLRIPNSQVKPKSVLAKESFEPSVLIFVILSLKSPPIMNLGLRKLTFDVLNLVLDASPGILFMMVLIGPYYEIPK